MGLLLSLSLEFLMILIKPTYKVLQVMTRVPGGMLQILSAVMKLIHSQDESIVGLKIVCFLLKSIQSK